MGLFDFFKKKPKADQQLPAGSSEPVNPNLSGHHDTAQVPPKKAKSFADLVFADKRDLVCGMPLTAGIADTTFYKGKLYGFCATGCKTEFLKTPKEYLKKK